jgi:hypothetical protein
MNTRLKARLVGLPVVLALVSAAAGCGYRLAGARSNSGAGQTIAVPTFVNHTTTYRIEQRLSDAVRRELIRSTRFTVLSEPSGDLVVAGEVTGYTPTPILLNDQGRAASYNISVDLKVVITDSKTGNVLFRMDRWTFRDRFELAQSSTEFVPEDPAAVDRLARRFASSLVSSLVASRESKP